MKKLLAGAAAAAAITAIPVGVSTANVAHAATAAPQCIFRIHYGVISGEEGHISLYKTCGGIIPVRAQAECFKDGTSTHEWRDGDWRTKNNKSSTAGCLSGWYIDNGGYQYRGSSTYYVLWRYTGTPLVKQ